MGAGPFRLYPETQVLWPTVPVIQIGWSNAGRIWTVPPDPADIGYLKILGGYVSLYGVVFRCR